MLTHLDHMQCLFAESSEEYPSSSPIFLSCSFGYVIERLVIYEAFVLCAALSVVSLLIAANNKLCVVSLLLSMTSNTWLIRAINSRT